MPAARAIVLDIEGTTSSASFVYDVLFPYARDRLATWVAAHPDAPEVRAVREESGDAVAEILLRWQDEDRKAPALKAIQGQIWDEGYADGTLVSHVYADVAPALRRWKEAGCSLWIFSSGSVRAQQALFGHTCEGDLTPLISGYFDLDTAGPKREPASYRRIADEITSTPLFLSDVQEELDAARAAGWSTIGVSRTAGPAQVEGHPVVHSFDDVALP